ncbi:hypothetical protein RHMOL_Rhmol08G0274300 [Rhododendron molle]|uniref:Uncharacterized protein n=1 Tax=Rhododendron molle TaxID=49168 RepID=A0ACC0MUA3_RHOML|nr:hypothetical protein RHMOL_Rhmol08G0274300 [Rhododendron molle]
MEEKKKQQQAVNGNDDVPSPSPSSSPWQALLVHLLSGLGLASALGVAHKFYSANLVSDPLHTLRLIWVIEASIVVLIYRAVVNALGAIVLGAPVGPKYFLKTVNWSLLMSLFTVVPAASVFGSSWTDWIRLFGHTKPSGSIDYMICLPAHGAVIGAWFGAWPMPLDWDRPWQEWPICVSYGAIAGYLIGMVASFGLVLLRGERLHIKGE